MHTSGALTRPRKSQTACGDNGAGSSREAKFALARHAFQVASCLFFSAKLEGKAGVSMKWDFRIHSCVANFAALQNLFRQFVRPQAG